MANCLDLSPKDAEMVMQLSHQDGHLVVRLQTSKEMPIERLRQARSLQLVSSGHCF